MKKQNIAIVAVVAFVLAVAVGYALFSDTLNITGSATAQGNLNVEFLEIGEVKSEGYTKQTTDPVHELAVIDDTKNKLTITVNKLDYQGAYVEIPVTIKNSGTIPAKLKEIREENLTSTDNELKVSYSGLPVEGTVLEPGDTQIMTVKVEWIDNDKSTVTSSTIPTFNIWIDYEQITVSTTTAGA